MIELIQYASIYSVHRIFVVFFWKLIIHYFETKLHEKRMFTINKRFNCKTQIFPTTNEMSTFDLNDRIQGIIPD